MILSSQICRPQNYKLQLLCIDNRRIWHHSTSIRRGSETNILPYRPISSYRDNPTLTSLQHYKTDKKSHIVCKL